MFLAVVFADVLLVPAQIITNKMEPFDIHPATGTTRFALDPCEPSPLLQHEGRLGARTLHVHSNTSNERGRTSNHAGFLKEEYGIVWVYRRILGKLLFKTKNPHDDMNNGV